MSQQQPRRPTNLPAGTSSLSDRIAALQKKNTSNGNGAASSRSSSANPAFLGASPSSSSASTHLSPNVSPARSISAGSQAVKDRIARFQHSDKPLLPKSSLGTPSPMDSGRQSNAFRAYPGANASGSGSGQWGENILRPQLTGGTWVGGGEGKGWAEAGSVRPQLTGSAWLGVGGSPSPGRLSGVYPAGATHRSPIRQRDAFLDLDDEARLSASPQKRETARRGSSFSEAQMAAASKGLARSSRASSNDGSDLGHSPVNERREVDVQPTLPTLPDTPSKSLPFLTVPGAQGEGQDETNETFDQQQARTLPSPPTEAPVTIATSPPRDVQANGDIEISVAGASAAKMRHLQRTLSASYEDDGIASQPLDASDDEAKTSSEKIAGPIPTAPVLQDLMATQGINAATSTQGAGTATTVQEVNAAQTVASSDDGADAIGRLATKSDFDEEEAASSSPISSAISPLAKVVDLPAILIARQSQHFQKEPEQVPAAIDVATPFSKTTEEIDSPLGISKEAEAREASSLSREMKETLPNGGADSDGTLTAANSSATMAPSKSDGEVQSTSDAQRRAKEAISMARSKSQRVKPPPVGRPMTVAEMDASDDEYEPGWASVISTTSNRT